MKYCLFFLISYYSSQVTCNSGGGKSDILKIVVIFSNHGFEQPIASSKTEFWKGRQYFDSIEIKSANLCSHFESKFRTLKVISDLDFDHRVAFIVQRKKSMDTLYTDEFFQYWHKGKFTLTDESNYFQTVFRPYLIRNLD